ncbi:unnamed protein product [Rotaria sp. Silwood2]|nr:unnamed protein product [Rotaria sp. Silwood2]
MNNTFEEYPEKRLNKKVIVSLKISSFSGRKVRRNRCTSYHLDYPSLEICISTLVSDLDHVEKHEKFALVSNVELFTSSDKDKLNHSCVCISTCRLIAPSEQSNDKITQRSLMRFNAS